MPEYALWAKSRSKHFPVDPPTVESHCQDVHRAAVSLWDAIEGDLASALQTSVNLLRHELRLLYFLAALLHDIGKANSSFQKLVRGNREKRQPVRHEVLSALLVSRESFLGQWLRDALTEQEIWAVAWAVGGHHLQMQAQTELDRENPLLRLTGSDKTVILHLSHPGITSLLLLVKDLLETQGRPLSALPTFQDQTFTIEENRPNSIEPLLRSLVKDSRKAWSTWKTNRQFIRRLAMLKSLLIAVDVAGSALVAEGLPVTEWITSALAVRLQAADLTTVVKNRLKGNKPQNFQSRVAESASPATVVVAGCGNGKTVAAYLWAMPSRFSNASRSSTSQFSFTIAASVTVIG